jgi:hypothetical protein
MSANILANVSLRALILGILDYILTQTKPGVAEELEKHALSKILLLVMKEFTMSSFKDPIEATSEQISDITAILAIEALQQEFMLEGIILLSLKNTGNTTALFKDKVSGNVISIGIACTHAWSRIRPEILRTRILDQFSTVPAFISAAIGFDKA